MAQWVKNPASVHEDVGSIPGLTLGLGSSVATSCGIGWQVRLGSHVAVAGGGSSDSTPSLGTSICRGHSPPPKNSEEVLPIMIKLVPVVILWVFFLLIQF